MTSSSSIIPKTLEELQALVKTLRACGVDYLGVEGFTLSLGARVVEERVEAAPVVVPAEVDPDDGLTPDEQEALYGRKFRK